MARAVLVGRRGSIAPAAAAAGGFADDLNRADAASLGTSSSGHTWTSSAMAIAGNKAKRSGAAGNAFIDSGLSDFLLQAVVVNGPLSEVGFNVRKTDANNYFYAVVNGDIVYVLKFEAGVASNLGNAPVSGGNTGTHTFKVTGVGSTIKVFMDGTEVHSVSSAFNQTATRHGIGGAGFFATDTTTTYDDVLCTTP